MPFRGQGGKNRQFDLKKLNATENIIDLIC